MEAHRPGEAFAEIEALQRDAFLARFPLVHTTRAEALTRLGRDADAAALDAALSATLSALARQLLARRLGALQRPAG
jgi:predicted RNA polymerase sigma factor